MRRIVTGILAHVDAGKTTCIESMLYTAGIIRKMGRVDHQDCFLDYDEQERSHGITIYSKEAFLTWKGNEIYIIDTPGHVDFSSEMERVLRAIDIAVIVINGQDGVQSHTETIWKCLEHYEIPSMIFVNKMDISYFDKNKLMQDINDKFSDYCVDFSGNDRDERIAVCSDELFERYAENGIVSDDDITTLIYERKCVPVVFGSALKNDGIDMILETLTKYHKEKNYPENFGARVYKISSDDKGNRLTHIKMTGGKLRVKQSVFEEKIDQIRIYNGKGFLSVNEAEAGMICTLKGLNHTRVGDGLGFESSELQPVLMPVLNYNLVVPKGADVLRLSEVCQTIAQEDPQLKLVVDEQNHIQLQIMGKMQLEILQNRIFDKTGIKVSFDTGKIIYKETISSPVRGYGHFEPLRHFAEAVIDIIPLPPGSGIQVKSECSTDVLSASWQRTIIGVLETKRFKGVLTRSEITDVLFVLIDGKGHLKHTEGGDFREAVSRAVRQGLMKAENILLEPIYKFELTLPSESLSRALYDLEQRNAEIFETTSRGENALITGIGPVRTLMNYQSEVIVYSKGKGIFQCIPFGYAPSLCQKQLVQERGYDPETDYYNTAGSVFCWHGSGHFVPWDEVESYFESAEKTAAPASEEFIAVNDLERILENSGGRNRNEKKRLAKKITQEKREHGLKVKASPVLPECIIVDGYNVIHSWNYLQEIAEESLSDAREKLLEMLANYQAFKNARMIIVFDGYKVQDNYGTKIDQKDISIIYTKTNETADYYIEKLAHDLKGQYAMTVVTSDGLIQNAVFSQGALRMSARELENQLDLINKMI